GGSITLMGTDGGSTPDGTNIDGAKGRGGIGGHVSGKLNFAAPPTDLTSTSGSVTVLAGDGGSGGRAGGTGGGIFGFDINAVSDISLTAGNGANFDPTTGSKKSNGGFAGTINSVEISTSGDVSLTSGDGGGGSTTGQMGGTI